VKRQRVIIMGAAGRDFHNFNKAYRDNRDFEVVAFTAAQIPFIERRRYPPELAGTLYPKGIPIHPEEELSELIALHKAEQVVFAYSDITHADVMHKASLVLSLGADFTILGPEKTMLTSKRPVISVCAVRTGCGKSMLTRYIAAILKRMGLTPVVIRHPMPYADLVRGQCQRFERMGDLDLYDTTIEEREEFEPLINAGVVTFAGVDYGEIVRQAETEGDILIWDGGNNDLPFIRPGLELVVLDPHRPGHERSYYPGEANLMRADIAVINKVDTAERDKIEEVEGNIRRINPGAKIVHTASPITVEDPSLIHGKRVLVVEDGPTLTHGGMPYGAGLIAARKFGASEVVDPRPYVQGSIEDVFNKYPLLNSLLPAMGYSPAQREDLRETIEAIECDTVIVATPVDLKRLLNLQKETVRVRYEIEECKGTRLRGYIAEFAKGTTGS
jgi:predicted GTPase